MASSEHRTLEHRPFEHRLLVVLDFNGTILDSTHHRRTGVIPHDRARHKYVYYRPGMREFIAWLMAHPSISVAVWTSNIRANAEALVRLVFPDPSQLAFVFSRDECVVHADFSSEKHAQRIFDLGLGFTPDRTLMVDDSPGKVVHPDKDAFYYCIDTFEASPSSLSTDQALQRLRADIEKRLSSHKI